MNLLGSLPLCTDKNNRFPPPTNERRQELEELGGRVQEQARHTRAKQGHQDKLRVQVAALDQRIREAHQRWV